MNYNYLKDARLIKNSDLCRYDSKIAYSTDFSTNGDVDGWELYNNIYLYGQWSGVLFGTAYDACCYIGRPITFIPLEAEHYYIVQIMMKITLINEDKRPTSGKLQWTTINNSIWDDSKEYTFDLYTVDDQWHLYSLNLGPSQYWQGDINNLRVYPFIDGHYQDKFAIKYIRVTSINKFICSNRQCSYYSRYLHPCPGAGNSGSVTAGIEKEYYTTYSGTSDELLVNIDNYGNEKIHLGTNINIGGRDIARIITGEISRLNVGSYTYAYAEHTEYLKLKIHSGVVGSSTSVVLEGGSALECLGFIDSEGSDVSVYENGVEPKDGFDYAGSRRLKGFEINNISNSDIETIAYYHSPSQYNVEAGRREFDNSSTASNFAQIMGTIEHVDKLQNIGCTIIDVSHPVNDSGRINHIYVDGDKEHRSAKVLLLRPHKNGDFTVIEEMSFDSTVDAMYTERHTTYRIDCNILVNKGDVFGFYNIDMAAPFNHLLGVPNAVYFKVNGKPSGRFSPGSVNANGTMGFAFYARSNRLQTNAILDVDLGQRTNIESVSVFGRELNDYFEYNIACCLDVSWDVNLYDSTHRHNISGPDSYPGQHVYHDNISYGIDCLNDCRRSSDNGQQGDTYSLGSTGMITTGDHAYFYVNGDSEWENSSVCDGKSEFCCPNMNTGLIGTTFEYENDPISFSLVFPYGFKTNVHKTILYFKEDRNFISLSISYYLGADGLYGNGPLPNFQLIPQYNSITLDGTEYVYGISGGFFYYDAIEDLLFKNPTTKQSPIIVGDKCVNQNQVATAYHVNWNIIEHKFNSVECGGICIHTDYHESTKINEFEVYSRFPADSTLVDNIDLQHSEYGDFWRPVSFVEDDLDSNRVNSPVAASPRYLIIDISSQLDFELYGICVYVSEEAKIEDCEKSISLDNTKIGAISDVKVIELENIFNRPYDLSVNLPSDLIKNTGILSWMTMDSEESVEYPEVGPGGIIHKNEDFLIRNDSSQCAINCPCYGLKNLLLDKRMYHYVHGDDDGWEFFITYSGASLGYGDVSSIDETIVTFSGMSSKYWKIDTDESVTTLIDTIEVYSGEERKTIDRVYIESPKGIYSQPEGYDRNGHILGVSSLINDTTGEPVDLNWASYSGYDVDDDYAVDDSGTTIWLVDYGTKVGTDHWHGVECTAEFDGLTDFTFNPRLYKQWQGLYWDTWTQIDFVDQYDTVIISASYYSRHYGIWEYVNCYGVNIRAVSGGGNVLAGFCEFYVQKQGGNLIYGLDGVEKINSNIMFEFDSVCKMVVKFYTHYGYNPEHALRYIRTPVLTSNYAFGFSFLSSEAIDKISIRHIRDFPAVYNLHVGNTNADDYIKLDRLAEAWSYWDKSTSIVLSNNDMTAVLMTTNNWESLRAAFSMAPSSGKYYWEVSIGQAVYHMVAIADSLEPLSTYIGDTATTGGYSYNAWDGKLYKNNTSADFGDTYTAGDVIGVALDMYSLKLWFSKNGVWQGSGNPDPFAGTDPATTISSYTYYAAYSLFYYSSYGTINFGKDGFSFTPPAGFENGFPHEEVMGPVSQKLNGTYYKYLITDLEQRYRLDFIRNYGILDDKYNLHLSTDIEYSTSSVSSIYDIVWDGTSSDTRWLKIPLLCGASETTKAIDTLGLYPDITQNIAPGGGRYNCEWDSLGDRLANYNSRSKNVALTSTVSGSSTVVVSGTYDLMIPMSADRTIDGYHTDGFDRCWGFEYDDPAPTLELELDDLYVINNIQLFHGHGEDTAYTNNDFTIEVATVSGGPFTEIISITGNTDLETMHVIDDTSVRFVKVKVTQWQCGDPSMYSAESEVYIRLDGGFLREIAIWTSIGGGEVNSEDYPVICMDLGYQFNVTSCGLVNKHIEYDYGKPSFVDMWGDSELLFKYSDDHYTDPNKVVFSPSQAVSGTVYMYSGQFLTYLDSEMVHTFDSSVYFDIGTYTVAWESFANADYSTVNLHITSGDYIVSMAPSNPCAPGTWVNTTNTIRISNSGFYSINADREDSYAWGVRNITITGKQELSKWIVLTCNKATDYSYDGSDKGIKYLDYLKVYGDEKYNPLEYSRWWYSVMSSLSNDSIMVREGRSSLKIDYPTSSGIDLIEFLEGDKFGLDKFWSELDVLSFGWYIEDINKLDLNYGGFMFGNLTPQQKPNVSPPGQEEPSFFQKAMFEDPEQYDPVPIYYLWNISSMNLTSGWNNIKLKFCDFDSIVPPYISSKTDLDIMSNFRNRQLTSFGMLYKGSGSSFSMYLDNLKIERNRFLDTVKFSNGLCLTWGEFLDVPLSSMTINTGTVEFWMKPYYNDLGVDLFGTARSRTLFTLTNNNNDIVSLGIKSLYWFEIGVGNSDKKYNTIAVDSAGMIADESRFEYKDIIHVALTWSNKGIGMDNKNTIRFYVNGKLILSSSDTWEVGDNKSVNLRLGGGNCTSSYNSDHDGSAIFDNLKAYNYCKTSFDIEDKGIDNDSILTPNDFLQLSSDGINFYGPKDGVLPLEFEQVPVGEKRTIHLRCNKSKEFKNMNKKTGDLEVTWTAVV